MNEKVFSMIENYLKEDGWKYIADKDKCEFRAIVNMNNVVGELRIIVFVRENNYTVSAFLNSSVEREYYNQVAEYLHRANFGMQNGNFEFDYDDGQIAYKTFVNTKNIVPSVEVIRDSILIPVFMFDRYGKGLIRLMLEKANPKELIEEAESIQDSDEKDKETAVSADE